VSLSLLLENAKDQVEVMPQDKKNREKLALSQFKHKHDNSQFLKNYHIIVDK
jgi:hypothetical protein